MDHVARDISAMRDVNDNILKKISKSVFYRTGSYRTRESTRGTSVACRDELDRDRQSPVLASRAGSGRQLCAADATRQAPVFASRVKDKISRNKFKVRLSAHWVVLNTRINAGHICRLSRRVHRARVRHFGKMAEFEKKSKNMHSRATCGRFVRHGSC